MRGGGSLAQRACASEARHVALRTSYRLLGAVGVLVAISYEVATVARPGWSATDYFSYFTELSNLFAAAMFLLIAARNGRPRSKPIEMLRGACVVYMLTTGSVYALLLSGQKVNIPWVNAVVHIAMPLLVTLDWLLDPPKIALRLSDALLWLAFPAVWCAYTLIRGLIVHWYPYFFIDPRRSGGYVAVAIGCTAIGLGIALLSIIVAKLGDMLGQRWTTSIADAARSSR